jgi:hypothetical protein
MAVPRVFRSFGFWAGVSVVLWLFVAGACLAFAILDPKPDLQHASVVLSALYTVGFWFGVSTVMLRAGPREWSPRSRGFRLMRLGWTLTLAMLLLHIVFAFWRAHEWSHDAAVRHVEATAGFGWAIVVNYLFAAVWLADVVWWWANPDGYANRPPWAGYAVHGFLAFVVFNATVVFGSAELRVTAAGMFATLAVVWWRNR